MTAKDLVSYGRGKEPLTHSVAVETGRLGGKKKAENRKRRQSLREMFEAMGDSKPTQTMITVLSKFGIDVSDKNTIEAMLEFAKLKANDKRTNMGDIIKFIELFAKYTGQEPATEIKASGFSVVVADKKAKDALEDV